MKTKSGEDKSNDDIKIPSKKEIEATVNAHKDKKQYKDALTYLTKTYENIIKHSSNVKSDEEKNNLEDISKYIEELKDGVKSTIYLSSNNKNEVSNFTVTNSHNTGDVAIAVKTGQTQQ